MQPRRVLAYVRVSGAEQGRTGTSLDGQRDEIARHCAAGGLPEPRFYVEIESAGAEKLERRAKLRSLLEDVAAGDLVVVAKQDRWSRDTLFYLKSTRDIVARGAGFLSLAERFDPSTPEGTFAATIMAAVAEQERARIYTRTVGRRRELRAQGCWIEGPPPFGYRVQNRRLVVVPEEAAIVRQIYARCIRGSSVGELGEWLRESGARRTVLINRHPGSSWPNKTVHGILRARWYLGQLEVGPGVWRAAHEAIVDLATYEQAQAAMASRRLGGMRGTSTSKTSSWLGRGLLSCALCGSRMGSAYRSSKIHGELFYYACGGRLRRHACDNPFHRIAGVHEQLDVLARARLVELRLELGKGDAPQPRSSAVEDLRRKLDRTATKRERTIDLMTDGTIELDAGRARLVKLDAELGALSRAIGEEEMRTRTLRPELRRDVLRELEQLERAWRKAPVEVRRQILAHLAAKLTLGAGGEVAATWRTVGELVLRVGSRG